MSYTSHESAANINHYTIGILADGQVFIAFFLHSSDFQSIFSILLSFSFVGRKDFNVI